MGEDQREDRSHLPMPTVPRTGPVFYDAKDPDAKVAKIEQLRPPRGRRTFS